MTSVEPTSASDSADVETIVRIYRDACSAVEAGDVEGLMAMFHDIPGTFLYDYMPPRSADLQHLRATFAQTGAGLIGTLTCQIVEIDTYLLGPDVAYTASIMHVKADYDSGDDVDVRYRATDIWKKIDGRWAVVHEHASLPVDPVTGQADLSSAPA